VEIETDFNFGDKLLSAGRAEAASARLYAGKIHELDDVLGGFLRHLSAQPFAGRTLVVLSS